MCRGLLRHLRLSNGLRASARSVLPLVVAAGLAGDALLSAPEALLDLLVTSVVLVWAALLASLVPRHPASHRGRASLAKDPRLPAAVLFGAAALSAIAIRLLNGSAEVITLALFVAASGAVLRRAGRPDETLSASCLTLLLFAVFLLLERHVGYVGLLLDHVAGALSLGVSGLAPGTVDIGAGFLGIRLVVLAMVHALSIAALGEGADRPRRIALAVISIAACGLAYSFIWSWLSNLERVQSSVGVLQPFAAPYDYRLLLLLLLAVPLTLVRAGIPPRTATRAADARPHPTVLLVTIALGVSVIMVTAQTGTADPGHRVIVLDTTGRLAEDVPVYGRYGLDSVGQFGLLPGYLQATGLSGAIASEITSETLADADTLVILNLRTKFDETTRQSIWEFIEAGGGLLVAGDHTGREEIRDPSNHLLEPVGIALGFDSAIPLSDHWANGFEFTSHPVFRGIAEEELQIVIGASLTAVPPARPLLLGRAGYSDAGDTANVAQGFLGDMAYTREERMGDLTLAAEATYGRGRVLVFGDTTFLQNLAISRSYRFLDNVFAWLGRSSDASAERTRTLVGALLLVVAAVALASLASRFAGLLPLAVIAIALGLAVSGVAFTPASPSWDSRPFADRHAVIDVSHHELGSLDRSSDSLDGLTANLVRAGLHPFIMRTFSDDMLLDADVIVLPAPTRAFDPGEIAALDEAMRAGSLLVLTTGTEKPYGSFDLLQHLGYRLGGAPMGRASAGWNEQRAQFWSAWPLVDESGGASQVIAEVWDSPVILYQPRGRGGSLVIADAAFLLEKNLEGLDRYDTGNIEFLRTVLGTYARSGEHDE